MAIDRRTWLKRTGAAALGATVLRGLPGCGDDELAATDDVAVATDAAPGDATSDVATATDSGADSSPDALGEVGDDSADDTAASDTETPDASPEPALTPLRRDGSHPYDYIDHIVILQMENRSFDHYFGSLKLVEGRQDVDGLTADMHNLMQDGTPLPVAPAAGDWIVEPDPPHSRGACVAQWAEGACSGFVTEYEKRTSSPELKRQVMSYHTRDELPALYGLADGFTLCHRWHCGMLGPTWPNRFFSHAATSEGLTFNAIPLATKTIYTHALAAGLTYGVYHRSPVHFALTMLDPAPGSYPSQDIERFFVDAAAGELPNLTVIEPDYSLDDDHPPQDIRLGQILIRSVYEALRRSPHWDRTLFLVFYDEHGGFFDHVPPPVPAGETRADFERMGFRVPGVLAGGLVRRGFVLDEVVEHSSVPALIARVFGLEHVNERARLAGDFAAALDLDMIRDARRPAPIALPPIDIDARRLELAHDRARPNQPELEAYARERFGVEHDAPSVRRAKADRYLERARRLGAVRIT
ncbi:MAG: hypothetical protein IT385_28330 [Deltaproteobacteria bacterium]|nr:hypothetical protein [Deltaproteobacteria bacterium]